MPSPRNLSEKRRNGGLIRELPQNPLNSGLGIILIWPDRINRKVFFLIPTVLVATRIHSKIVSWNSG